MIAAILQPYFFPYIGYFQLMQAVDVFVFFDDVQYIDRGWVNRNRIRCAGRPAWLTLPVRKDHRELPINQRQYLLSNGDAARRVEQQLQAAYREAPCWAEAAKVVSGLLAFADANVATFNTHLLMELAQRLNIECRFLMSSQIDKPAGLKGQAKIIDLCLRVGASHYINPIGGVGLYDCKSFDREGLQLSFLQTTEPPLDLPGGPQHLSIIDGLMHQGFVGCRARLEQYQLQAAA